MIAVIGGSGVDSAPWLSDAEEERVETPWGPVVVIRGQGPAGRPGLFLHRHAPGHRRPPHRVNYRGNVWAVKHLGAESILATAAVGSLNPALVPGTCVLPDQFLDFTRGRPLTFYDDEVVHTDMTEPFSRDLIAAVVSAGKTVMGLTLVQGGCYVTTDGPRFETAAEIRAYRTLGADVVGMTLTPEVVLAREVGLPYATIALVTNWAAGLADDPLSQEEVYQLAAKQGPLLTRLITESLLRWSPPKGGSQ